MLIEGPVETGDVQTLLFTGYPKHEASFHLLWVGDAVEARRGLGRLDIRFGNEAPPEAPAVHIAFTAAGLAELGVDAEIRGGFSLPFREGMDSEHRRRALGDVGENDPGRWDWGQPRCSSREQGVPHAILLVYDRTDSRAAARRQLEALRGWEARPLLEPRNLSVSGRKSLKEHFGFDDGIGNPDIRGINRETLPHNIVAAGEFLLGYPNEAGLLPASPHVPPGAPGGHVLPNGNLGRNGSYLVVRQLEQHVRAFWTFLLKQRGDSADEAIGLAAKMVGRWPNGAPLAIWSSRAPADSDPPSTKNDEFLYATDPHGHGCPIGAHIRRANPRDSVPLLDPERSLSTSKQRRLLRRGRAYGSPLRGALEGAVNGWPDPHAIASSEEEDRGRGLYFLCFVADLERQYEFVQQAWINSRKFGGLSNDADPLLSNPELPPNLPRRASDFTLQREALNEKVIGLEQFVTVRGSAYFFMPGKRALAYLSQL